MTIDIALEDASLSRTKYFLLYNLMALLIGTVIFVPSNARPTKPSIRLTEHAEGASSTKTTVSPVPTDIPSDRDP